VRRSPDQARRHIGVQLEIQAPTWQCGDPFNVTVGLRGTNRHRSRIEPGQLSGGGLLALTVTAGDTPNSAAADLEYGITAIGLIDTKLTAAHRAIPY